MFSEIFHTQTHTLYTLRLVSPWGCPGTLHTLQKAALQPGDIPYCPAHSIPFRRPPYGAGTSGGHPTARDCPTVPQHTLASGRAYPAYPAYIACKKAQGATQTTQTTRLQTQPANRKHNKENAEKPSRGNAEKPSRGSLQRQRQQSKGLYVASANKGSNGLGKTPPCQLDKENPCFVAQNYNVMKIHRTVVGGNIRKI